MSAVVDRLRRVERAVRESKGRVRYFVSDSPDGSEELSPELTEAAWEEAYGRGCTAALTEQGSNQK